jgi:hypothetical protein
MRIDAEKSRLLLENSSAIWNENWASRIPAKQVRGRTDSGSDSLKKCSSLRFPQLQTRLERTYDLHFRLSHVYHKTPRNIG